MLAACAPDAGGRADLTVLVIPVIIVAANRQWVQTPTGRRGQDTG